MDIRKAQLSEYNKIMYKLRNKHLSYATAEHLRADLENNRLFIIESEDRVIAMCALVYDAHYNYYALKRLVVFNKKDCGKGYALKLIQYISSLGFAPLGCTPWNDNKAMKKLLAKAGFTYQYTFQSFWQFYKKTIDK